MNRENSTQNVYFRSKNHKEKFTVTSKCELERNSKSFGHRLRRKIIPEIPIIGRDDHNGSWYVRIPLWMQTTLLILLIGFLSILLVVLVSAIQVWNYSEQLMRDRLSTSASMVGIGLEQKANKVVSVLESVTSRPIIINLIRFSETRSLNDSVWLTAMDQLGIELSLVSNVRATILYDRDLNPLFKYSQQLSSKMSQYSLLSQNFYPLSNPKQRHEMVDLISNSTGSVLANSVITNNKTLIFSVTCGVSAIPYFSNSDTNLYFTGSTVDLIGFATFIMEYNLTLSAFPESTFRNYMINVVRANDIKNHDKTFKFLFPHNSNNGLISQNKIYDVTQFPVLQHALSLIKNSSSKTAKAKNLEPTKKTDYTDSEALYSSISTTLVNKSYPVKNLTKLLPNSSKRNYTIPVNTTNANLTTKVFNSSGDLNLLSKFTKCDMRTRTAEGLKSSICYTYANMLDQKWLVFVAIPESDAFVEVRHVRNVVVGVGVGILGVVLIIVLPLSILQTRGLYTIYQNMKLRPMFIVDKNLPNDSTDDSTDLSPGSPPFPPPPPNNTPGSTIEYQNGEEKNIKKTENINPGDSTSSKCSDAERNLQQSKRGYVSCNNLSHVHINDTHYQFTVPLPLPYLNRWYTDETDDLIDAYNNLTEKLNSQYLHLEDKVKSRTKEAQKARELREMANTGKSEFIAIISHELRTPLNGIMGLTAVSVEEHNIEKVRSALRIIIDSGHVLMGLLNELLQLSKSLVGVDPVVQEFSASKFLHILPTLFSSRTPNLSVTFGLATIPKQLSSVLLRGDLEHTAHICLNFMSNAMKFSEKNGKVSVLINMRPMEDKNVSIAPYGDRLKNANAIMEILVTDEGLGISPTQLSRIFDLFVQGEDPLRKNHKGAGLGMAISKQLAEGIGGYVTVFSAKDVGSTVVLRVPVEAVGLSDEEVLSFNALPIYFKVRNVYTTTSLNAGEVKMVDSTETTGNLLEPVSAKSNSQTTSFIASKWSRLPTVSSNSKLDLNKNSPVAKFLRPYAHDTKQSSHSHQSSQVSGNTNVESLNSDNQEDSTHPKSIVLTNAVNSSASSLLWNVPDNLFDGDNNTCSASQYLFSSESGGITPQRPSSLKRPSHLTIPTNNPDKKTPSPISDTNENQSSTSGTNRFGHSNLVLSPVDMSVSPTIEVDSEMRVLIAEDNKLNQQIMVKMLRQLGFKHIDAVEDGDSVIKMVEKSIVGGYHYAVIFMDLSMPGKNGIDSTHHIRGTLGYPYPIIALTGFSDIETRNACMTVNIQEVLVKPVMKHDIIRVLHNYCSLE